MEFFIQEGEQEDLKLNLTFDYSLVLAYKWHRAHYPNTGILRVLNNQLTTQKKRYSICNSRATQQILCIQSIAKMRCIFLLDLHKNRQKTEWDFGCPLRPTISLLDLHRLGPQTCSMQLQCIVMWAGRVLGGYLQRRMCHFYQHLGQYEHDPGQVSISVWSSILVYGQFICYTKLSEDQFQFAKSCKFIIIIID